MASFERERRVDMWWFRYRIRPASSRPLRGVNLGGWLVLEKWITPSLFKDTDAVDEYTLSNVRSRDILRRIREHRDHFITEADFAWMARHGVEAVRLPVGYWTFGDEKPYQPTIKYVDKVFVWAKKYDLKVLLDLHGVRGSQNGKAHSGRAGEQTWPKFPVDISDTVGVVEKLAQRYGGHRHLLGIELMNEPSPSVDKAHLKEYYQRAYAVVREHCGPDVWVVFHDNFKPRRWRHELRGKGYANVFIDTHHYQFFSPSGKRHDFAWHLKRLLKLVPYRFGEMMKYHPLIIGEWSLAVDTRSTGKLDSGQIDALSRAYAGAQLLAYSHAAAWFFWTYKTERSASWSYRYCVQHGWLPGDKK